MYFRSSESTDTLQLIIIGPTSQAAIQPDNSTLVDEVTSPHLQGLITTQKVIDHHPSTNLQSDFPDQTSTQGTQETRNNNTTAIVLSITFTLVLILIAVLSLVAVLIIMKLSRKTNNRDHRSDESHVLLNHSDSQQEENLENNDPANVSYLPCESILIIGYNIMCRIKYPQ